MIPFTDQNGVVWTLEQLGIDYSSYEEVLIDVMFNLNTTEVLNKDDCDLVKVALNSPTLIDEVGKRKITGGNLISNLLTPAKYDYVDDFDRGSVYFTSELRNDGTPENRNYSYHKVIIPDGEIIINCNFTQKEPDTDCITGGNLTFRSCNLKNVKIDGKWILEDCSTGNFKRKLISQEDLGEGVTKVVVSLEIEKEGKFEEIERYDELILSEKISTELLKYNS